jgi:hypothetical protein
MGNAKSKLHLGLLMMFLGASDAGACGGSSGTPSDGSAPAGTSGVTGSKRLDALTTDEKMKLCDFTAALLGGYGASKDCGGGVTLDANASQADCVAKAPTTCAAIVSQAEACAKGATCADPFPAVCAPLLQCH